MRIAEIQDLNALVGGRLDAQMRERTVNNPRRRFFGGALSLPAPEVAPSTTLAASRLLLQTDQVRKQLGLSPTIAGPGTV